jgi:hypothetical protein
MTLQIEIGGNILNNYFIMMQIKYYWLLEKFTKQNFIFANK